MYVYVHLYHHLSMFKYTYIYITIYHIYVDCASQIIYLNIQSNNTIYLWICIYIYLWICIYIYILYLHIRTIFNFHVLHSDPTISDIQFMASWSLKFPSNSWNSCISVISCYIISICPWKWCVYINLCIYIILYNYKFVSAVKIVTFISQMLHV